MTSPLILHAGMPKTGTSSIQETLFQGLKDSRFHYVGLGLVNGSRPIQCLVGDHPVVRHVHEAQGIDRDAFARRAPDFRRCWERQLMRARKAGAIPIVSAEDCWFLTRDELARLGRMIESLGFQARVVVYLRPPLEWLASMFQELVKSGHHAFADELLLRAPDGVRPAGAYGCDYLRQITAFEDVFGAGNLTLRIFRSQALVEGCVVADFCRQCGIAMPRHRIRRVNESLSLDAMRFLFAFNRFCRMQERRPFGEVMLLLRRLREELPGRPLRLHPDLLSPVVPPLTAQLSALRERCGIDLFEDRTASDDDVLRCEHDMFRYSRSSLEWLAAAVGEPSGDGRATTEEARLVAHRLARLRPLLRHRLQEFVDRKVRRLRLWRANR